MKLALAVRLGGAFCMVALLSCASPPVPLCQQALVANPPLTPECRLLPESASYLEEAGERFGARLDSWRSYPGRLDLSIAYDGDARIQTVCLRQGEGDIARERAPSAVKRLLATRPAPSCFANRRVELRWESALVTEAEYRRVAAKCSGERPSTSKAEEPELCSSLTECEEKGFGGFQRRAVSGETTCMLRYLPVSFGWVGSDQLLTFLPREGQEPGRDDALSASQRCESKPDREALVACMYIWGWEPVDWEQRRTAIMDADFD